jgi:DinB family protein
MTETPADVRALEEVLDDVERDARVLIDGMSEQQGGWRAVEGTWSVSECLDHLGTANRVYVGAMLVSAIRAREQGRVRHGPATPGIIGRWFVTTLEPPVKSWFRMTAPGSIRPLVAPPLGDAVERFLASHAEVRGFLRAYADLDLAGIRFVNPFIRGVRFSLATGLHVIVAHERRHLWQAWRVRRDLECAGAAAIRASSQTSSR